MKNKILIGLFFLIINPLLLWIGPASALDYGWGLKNPSFFKYFKPLLTENNQRDFIGEWVANPVPTGMDTNEPPSHIRITLDKDKNILVLIGGLQASYASQKLEIGGRTTLRGNLNNGTNYIISMDGTYGLIYDVYARGAWHRKFYNQNLGAEAMVQELIQAKVIDRYTIEPYYSQGASLPTDILAIFMGPQRREIQLTNGTISLLKASGIPGTSY